MLFFSFMTYLAVPIGVDTAQAAAEAIEQARRAGAEMLELRLDYLTDPSASAVEQTTCAAKRTGLPVIATCRAAGEGGHFTGTDQDRQTVLLQALRAGADYIDIELASLAQGGFDELANQATGRLIISNHDFDSLPGNLHKHLADIEKRAPAVSKVVYMANSITDNFAALDIVRDEAASKRAIIALAMGEAGIVSRLLARKLGAFLTFASLARQAESAPGQVTVEQMRDTYRWDKINANTSVYGVIGYPVGHSMSPAIHNAAFEENGFNGLYLPLLVGADEREFSDFLDGVIERKWLGFKGVSVTIPHKDNALNYVRARGGYLEPLAEKIGAVNTLLIASDGRVSGYNTDYAGALDAIVSTLGIARADLKGWDAAVVGAGGVARAVVAGLVDVGAEVTIYNRTVARAERLAEEFAATARPLAEAQSLRAQLVINCSSIGMHPNTEASPVPARCLRKGMVVFDTVYNPWRTLLLRQAAAAGAQVVDGVSMFVNQAAAQFEMFTQQPAPKEVMRRVVELRLGGIRPI